MTCGRVGVVTSMDFSAYAFQISMSLLPALLPFFILWRALKAVLDVCLDVLGEEVAGVALDGGAVLPNQELLKVPRNVCPPHWFPNQEVGAGHKALRVIRRCWQGLFEECEKWMLVLSVHLNLVEHVALELEPVARPDMLQQVDNLLSTAVLLVAKLVGGEGEDSKVARELEGSRLVC